MRSFVLFTNTLSSKLRSMVVFEVICFVHRLGIITCRADG